MTTGSTTKSASSTDDIHLPTAAILILSMTAYVLLVFIVYLIRKYLKSKEMCTNLCSPNFSCNSACCPNCAQLCDCHPISCDNCLDFCCPRRKLHIVDLCLCRCFNTEGLCKNDYCSCQSGLENIRCGCCEISIRNTSGR